MSTKYLKTTKLGEGTTSKVYECCDSDEKMYAVKFFNDIPTVYVLKEMVIMERLKNCERVVKYHEFLRDKKLGIVLPLFKRNLARHILKNNINIKTVKQLLYGLYEIHHHGIIHGDIKAENVLVDENFDIYYGDFGHSSILPYQRNDIKMDDGCSMNYFCTSWYRPPEFLSEKKRTLDFSMDIWSLGIVFVEILLGKYIYRECYDNYHVLATCIEYFGEKEDLENYEKHRIPHFTRSISNKKPFSKLLERLRYTDLESFIDFLPKMLSFDPNKRPKSSDFLDLPFMKEYKPLNVNIQIETVDLMVDSQIEYVYKMCGEHDKRLKTRYLCVVQNLMPIYPTEVRDRIAFLLACIEISAVLEEIYVNYVDIDDFSKKGCFTFTKKDVKFYMKKIIQHIDINKMQNHPVISTPDVK